MKDICKWIVYAGIFAVPFLVLFVSESMFFPYITGKNFTFRIIVEIMLAAWVLLMLYDSRYRPRFSWIAASGLGLLVVMFFANIFGEYAPKSFWSNFERMEGYVTLVHFYLYFIITATMLTIKKLWDRFFNTTLVAALMLSFYGFAQIAGSAEVSQGGWRIDTTLGNSTYMAIYMLFHIAIAALMFVRTRSKQLRYLYAGMIVLFVFLLLQTGTRGTTLGLFGGTLLTTTYMAIFAKGYPTLRKIALGGLVALMIGASAFIAFRDTEFVQNTPVLDRIADISLEEGQVRFMVWGTALEGIKDRPILGWGQGNFNYVFNQYYDPGLYRAETWYDRVHNVVLDWLIAGGIVGAFFYFGIIAAALYHTIVRLFIARLRSDETEEEQFSVAERGLLLGLLAAYVFHNLFVFDNLISYIFFAVILAFIHSRIATEMPKLTAFAPDRSVVDKVVAPTVGVVLIAVIYFVNVPGMQAAGDLIDALRAQDYDTRFAEYENALSRDSFADQEIVEQMTNSAMSLARDSSASQDMKDKYTELAKDRMYELIEEKPGDARLYVFLASVYRGEGNFAGAARVLAEARKLSPDKPDIILEQGILALQQNKMDEALSYFQTAYELAPNYERTRLLYTSGLMLADSSDRIGEFITEPYLIPFAESEIVSLAMRQSGAHTTVNKFYRGYIEAHPQSVPARTAYALWVYGLGDEETAIDELNAAVEVIPSYEDTASCYIDNIEAKKEDMRDGCIE